MSSALAIGAVSAVLRNLLDNGMVDAGPAVGTVKVTAVAPDTIKLDDPQLGPSLNLFLYRVSPNPGWRNQGLPGYDAQGERRSNPPLALDLHLLLTAYGSTDFHAEILLGYAMSILHEWPVLNRAAIRKALDAGQLGASILPPAFQALVASDLADQVESLKLTLEPLDTEEMSRLWSAMQAHYRPTAAYCVSVVLIEATKPVHTALPVLSRGTVDPVTKRDRGVAVQPDMGPPLPTLLKSVPANDQVAAMLGELVRLDGVHLNGTGVAVDFGHALLSTPNTVVIGVNDDPKLLDVSLPSGSVAEKAWPAGVWTVTVRLTRPGETVERTTNAVAMLLAPSPVLSPAPTVVRDPASGRVRVTVKVRPEVRPTQTAQLSIGGDTATADPHPTPTGTLTFHFGVIPDGARPVRVAVDGVESRLVDRSTVPPRYDPTQKITVPA